MNRAGLGWDAGARRHDVFAIEVSAQLFSQHNFRRRPSKTDRSSIAEPNRLDACFRARDLEWAHRETRVAASTMSGSGVDAQARAGACRVACRAYLPSSRALSPVGAARPLARSPLPTF